MSRFPYLLLINGAALSACAVFIDAERNLWLIGLMLFLPLLDKNLTLPKLLLSPSQLIRSGFVITTGLLLLIVNPDYVNAAMSTLIFAALPEEWFFRAYFMTRLEVFFRNNEPSRTSSNRFFAPASGLLPIMISSALFALLHAPTQGWFGLSTFFPALLYGWIYQKTQDLLLVILLHTISNLIFFIYLVDFIR